jgi:hypothetical protein
MPATPAMTTTATMSATTTTVATTANMSATAATMATAAAARGSRVGCGRQRGRKNKDDNPDFELRHDVA